MLTHRCAVSEQCQYAVGSGAASSTPPAGVSLTGSSLSVDPTDPSFDSIGLGENRIIITVTYNVTDEHGATVPQTATITIQGTNDVPTVAAALSASGTEDAVSPVVVNLLDGAADADASALLSVTAVQYSVNGGLASSTAPAGVSLTGSSLSVDPTDPSFDSIGLGGEPYHHGDLQCDGRTWRDRAADRQPSPSPAPMMFRYSPRRGAATPEPSPSPPRICLSLAAGHIHRLRPAFRNGCRPGRSFSLGTPMLPEL